MRILLVGDYGPDPRLGSAKVYYKLSEEIERLGHTCDVVLADTLGPRPAWPRLRWAAAPLLAAGAVRRAQRGGTYDVVDVASAEGVWIAAARRLRRSRNTAIVSRSHGLEHLNYRRMLDDADAGITSKPWPRRIWYPAARLAQVAAAARLADRLIVLNDKDREFAVGRGWKPANAIDVVPHGVSERFTRDRPDPAAPRGRGILFCGSWDPVKGTHDLVRAFTLLSANGEGPGLTILGPGLPADRVLSCFPERVRSRVTVLARAPEAEVMRHYRAHDLLVAPSTYEGFGMVVVEAMSQGLPVIATPVGAAADLVRHGDNGILVPPRDPPALAAALERLLADPPLRARLAAAGFDSARPLTWRRTAERTLEVYDRARGRHSAHAHIHAHA